MKKMTKLLSVILAFVMALSCMTMMASADKETYQTVQNLSDKNAYSPYGTVTRLTSEVRLSILFDSLDNLLAPLNITLSQPLSILGTLNIDLRSVTGVCQSIDNVDNLLNGGFSGFLVTIAKSSLGIIGKLELKNWKNGMTREGTPNLTIAGELFKLLTNNKNLVNEVLTNGLELGLIGNFLKGVDLSAINNLATNLPGAIKGIVYPLFSRQDDTQTERGKYSDTSENSNLIDVAQEFVNGLFTKPMAWTSYRTDANGNDLGYTDALPTGVPGSETADTASRYFVISADKKKITQYDYQYAGLLGDPVGGEWKETVTYTLSSEEEYEGSGTYLYKAPADYSGDASLKWYKKDGQTVENGRIQSAYWLPTVKAAMEAGTLTLKINENDSLLGLLYKFAPYIFAEMAPTVLNGSAKKLIAEAFDVKFTKIGVKGGTDADKVAAEATATGNPDNFFTKAQDFYVWEYSDYKVIDGVPYYRYQDTYFKGEIPKNISAYYYMFNWNWNISDNFMNEFIPGTDEFKPAVTGSTWALDGLNNLVKKAINTMIAETWTVKGKTYNRSEVFNWVEGGNDKLLNNLMVCARNFFDIAPEEIVDEYFKEAQFYDAMMNGTMNQAVNGLICELVKLIMPQIKFPNNIIDQPITAIAALVVRELCTQLMPTYNFDAMIYANYGKAGAPDRAIANHTANEWLDITLYMGVNLGMYYLRNIADVGEDSDLGYYSVMSALGAIPTIDSSKKNTTAAGDAITFTATSYKASKVDGTPASWLVAVDWIVDWALDENTLWCWHFGKLVDTTADYPVALASYQNPLNKIDKVLTTFIPELNNLLNVTGLDGSTYGSNTLVEKILKGGIIDSIVNLDVPKLAGMLKIPDGSILKKTNIADSLVQVIVTFLNSVTKKVVGGANFINSSTINSVSTLINHANLRTALTNIVGLLSTAFNNGLLDPILPIANFFIGWTTDPQKFADPVVYFTNDWNSTYLYKDNNPVMHLTNNASGMLLKHRNSTDVDTAYSLTVTQIDFENGLSTTKGCPFTVAPGETAEVPITVPVYGGTTRIKLHYQFTGKNNAALGGEQTSIKYVYVSDVTDQLNEMMLTEDWGVDKDWTQIANYRKYEFTQDIYTSVTNYAASVRGTDSTWNVYTRKPSDMYTNTAMTAPASNYFKHRTDYTAAGFTSVKKNTTSTGYLYEPLAGVTKDTVFPTGTYDMGNVAIKYGNSGKDYEVDFIYYDDFNISSVADTYLGYKLKSESFVDQTLWTAYETALMKAVELAGVAKRIDYVETIQPQIKPAIEALKTAYKNLMESEKSAIAVTVDDVQNQLNEIEKNPDRDINFQDYKLFEYFQYEKQRTAARNMIKSTQAPAAPEKYIRNGVGGNALVDAISNAQTNANIKAGIINTIVETSDPEREEEMKNYAQAVADFKPATYSDLNVQDQVAKLEYYHNFMTLNNKVIDKTFLNQEIAYAEAQNYDSALYSADSWSRYTEALANAKATAAIADADSKESVIFDAKYELMVAQNKLQLKERSMKDASENYLAQELKPLIDTANVILNNFGSSNSLYQLKDGVDNDAALGQLVSALGIKYNVTIDNNGTPKAYDGILYDRSAITFTEYDRTLTAKNKRAVDAAADKLRAAIENFECIALIEPNDSAALPVKVDQGVRYVQGITPGTVATETALVEKLKVTGGLPEVTASKAGFYGTGTRIDVVKEGALLASYFVVIYGDVNGDGVVDAFDAVEVDLANCTAYYMGDVYDDAADLNGDGIVNDSDYSALMNGVRCKAPISQIR